MRVRADTNKFLRGRSAGLRLQVLDTMEGVLGPEPVLLSPAGRAGSLWLAGQLRVTLPQGTVTNGQHIGRTSDSDSGVPASDDENVRGRRDSGEGSTRTENVHGESASSALEKAPVERCAGARAAEADDSE